MKIEYLGEYETDVYDLSMTDNHNFFGNDVLLHNCDTDSVVFSAKTMTYDGHNYSEMTMEELFNIGDTRWNNGEKEYSHNNSIKIVNYNNGQLKYSSYNYIYRHKVSKGKFSITSLDGKEITTTSDHSVMILENNELVEKKPNELKIGDKLVTLASNLDLQYSIAQIESVIELEPFDDEYVYDIGVDMVNPYFFANGILVHNSSYFSAYPVFKDQIERGEITWNRDTVIEFYDAVCEEVNKTFPEYMRDNHNSPDNFNHTIAAGREIIGSKGLFIKKKRYAIMVYDTEGIREDKNDSSGKMKAMGLDMKRSDTPSYMQAFLKEILLMVLENKNEDDVIERIIEFRKEFREMPPWEMGTPKRVNKLTHYYNAEYRINRDGNEEYKGKARLPGHVRAAINYNRLLKLHNDNFSMKITDGMKTIVCKLKDNPLGIKSIGIPTDENRIPEWFKELPFNTTEMENAIITKKIQNLLGVLRWDLKRSLANTTFTSLFDFD